MPYSICLFALIVEEVAKLLCIVEDTALGNLCCVRMYNPGVITKTEYATL